MNIDDVLARRTDLSTFLVHLTRDTDGRGAKERLKAILDEGVLRATKPMGQAVGALREAGVSLLSQRCVCFTETPLEHVSLLLNQIDGRQVQFSPYGIAITKIQARESGVNPVWYVDITPSGRDWLTNPLNELIDEAIEKGDFDSHPVAKIAPFVEQMGSGKTRTGRRYRKEFWWEREWRHVGMLVLPRNLLILSPQSDHQELRDEIDDSFHASFIDPSWSLEQIIAYTAGFPARDVRRP